MQLQSLIAGKREVKPSVSDEPNKRILSKLRAAQGAMKSTAGEKLHQTKDSSKRPGKKSRKKRRGQDDSRSTSHDKNSTIMPGKQIKITKDKHFLNPNLSKLMRKSINEFSHGQEKTLKLSAKQKEKIALEEKKKYLDTFNETIRKKNLKSVQISKENKGDSLGCSHVNVSTPVASVPVNPMGNYARKLNKIMKVRRDPDDTKSGNETLPGNTTEKTSAAKHAHSALVDGDQKRRRVPQQGREINQVAAMPVLAGEQAEVKKASQFVFKKVQASEICKASEGRATSAVENRDKTKDKKSEERKSSEEIKKRIKNKLKKESKKPKVVSHAEAEKIKENLARLSNKVKNALRHQQRAFSKRLTKQRRSKSSNDLLSDQMIKKMLDRSDSVNIKPGHNEDQMYQEFKNLISKGKKGFSQRDAALKDKILKKSYKERIPLAKQPSGKPFKLRQSKSSKVYKRPDSYPMKLKRMPGVNMTAPNGPQITTFKDTHMSDKSKEKEIFDKIHQLSANIQKNYENVPSLVIKTKSQLNQVALYMPSSAGGKRPKKTKSKSNKRKGAVDPDVSDDIPAEEKELIDKEILMPKSSSDYTAADFGLKNDVHQQKSSKQLESGKPIGKSSQKIRDGSQRSMRIKDSQSSEGENNATGDLRDMHSHKISQDLIDADQYLQNQTPRYSQEDPLSKDNLDKWMYLLQEFKNCQKTGNIDGELKDLLISFCDKTQKGLAQLIETGGTRKGISMSDQKPRRSESPKEDSRRRRNLQLDTDFDQFNNDFFSKPDRPSAKENRSNSFQWLRAEFEQNLEELGRLLGKNKDSTLKKIQDAMELNERYSEMFELRVSAINQRYEAEKEQIEKTIKKETTENEVKEALNTLDVWFKAEMESMDNEKKKITKGWFTSIEAIRKIKRDLEIAAEMKKGFTLKIPSKSHIKQQDDTGNIYGMLTKSAMSPSNKRLDTSAKRNLLKEGSPLGSPQGNSGFSHTKIISDPTLMSMKIRQGDMLSKKNEELAKSIEQIDVTRSYKDKSMENIKAQLEISDSKKNIVNEIDSGLLRYPKSDLVEVIRNTEGLKDKSPFGSPPHHSVASSNLYQISPTTLKRQSKVNSSNKPRSTQKSDPGMEDQSKQEDIIWIRDQSKGKSESLSGVNRPADYPPTNVAAIPKAYKDDVAKGSQNNWDDIAAESMNLHSPNVSQQLAAIAGQTKALDSESQNNLKDYHSHSEGGSKSNGGDISNRDLENELAMSGPVTTFNNKQNHFDRTPVVKKDLEATHPPGGSSGGLDSLKKELDKIPRATDSSQQEPSSNKDLFTREGTKRGLGKTQNLEHDDYLNDLTQGIGFDSGIIKNDFEDTKKSAYNLDDFASMSDSDRENHKRVDLLNKLNIVSDDILDIIFTDTISDIINMLENENMDFEREIASGYNQQIYLQDGQDQVTPQQLMMQRKGIRVNFNAVKEYISLLINFMKGSSQDCRRDILVKLNTPYGLTPSEKFAVFHEGLDDNGGYLSTARVNQRLIVSYDTYMKLEDELSVSREHDDQFRQGIEHIHNKMLFDSFNEALDSLRPYGLKGCPFQWRPNAGRIKSIEYNEEKVPEVLEKAQERVLDWAMFMCGFIPDKDDSMLGDIAIEDDYLNQIKEDRLIKMLTCEAFETDERWLIYDDEEVEVQTEVAELVFYDLLEETIASLIGIGKRKLPNTE